MSQEQVARFVTAKPTQALYESFYLRCFDLRTPRGAWIRYTVTKPPGAEPTGQLWFTFFDRVAGVAVASKQTHAALTAGTDGQKLIGIGDGEVSLQGATGQAVSERCQAQWNLTFDGTQGRLAHLPYGWMYRAAYPKTKLETLRPAATFNGKLAIDDREVTVDEWVGMVGHNWGAEHADQWVWLHVAGFETSPDTWLDLALARVRLGRAQTPWLAAGCIAIDGVRYRLGGLQSLGSTQAQPTSQGCEFAVASRSISVSGTIDAVPQCTVGWLYRDPGGDPRNVANCSIAAATLTLRAPGKNAQELSSDHGAAYEFGTRDQLDIELEPFAD